MFLISSLLQEILIPNCCLNINDNTKHDGDEGKPDEYEESVNAHAGLDDDVFLHRVASLAVVLGQGVPLIQDLINKDISAKMFEL